MGWSYDSYPTSKATFVRGLDDSITRNGHTIMGRHHSGNHYWRLIKLGITGEIIIILDLLARPGKGYGWGNKGMDESMGPYVYSCPLAWLDLAPQPSSEYCAKWREQVRAYHAERRTIKAGLKVGATVTLKSGFTIQGQTPNLTVLSLRPLRAQSPWGVVRLQRKHIGTVTV